MVCAET